MKSWLRTILYFLAVILVTASVTAGITVSVLNKEREDVVVLSAEEYAGISDLLFLDEMINRLQSDSLKEPPSRDALLDAAAKGIVAALDDPYAAYYTAEEYEAYLSNINGQYNGIGILIGQPDAEGALVLDVYDETPAAQAGVQPGDRIVAVDGVSIGGMLLDELAAAIDREVGESVALTLKRGEETLELQIALSQARCLISVRDTFASACLRATALRNSAKQSRTLRIAECVPL